MFCSTWCKHTYYEVLSTSVNQIELIVHRFVGNTIQPMYSTSLFCILYNDKYLLHCLKNKSFSNECKYIIMLNAVIVWPRNLVITWPGHAIIWCRK